MKFFYFFIFYVRADIFECNFETNWCGLIDIDGDFILSENVGETSTGSTGPIYDHTLGKIGLENGYYLYSECSWPRNVGDYGGVRTKSFRCPSGQGMVEAWVNLYAQDLV